MVTGRGVVLGVGGLVIVKGFCVGYGVGLDVGFGVMKVGSGVGLYVGRKEFNLG
jgi:hypothetical protein